VEDDQADTVEVDDIGVERFAGPADIADGLRQWSVGDGVAQLGDLGETEDDALLPRRSPRELVGADLQACGAAIVASDHAAMAVLPAHCHSMKIACV